MLNGWGDVCDYNFGILNFFVYYEMIVFVCFVGGNVLCLCG